MKITETLHTWSTCEIEGSLDSFIAMLKEFRESAEKKGYTNLKVELEDEWDDNVTHWVTFVIKGQKEVAKKKPLRIKGPLQTISARTKNRPY
jgi:hypothetical protein